MDGARDTGHTGRPLRRMIEGEGNADSRTRHASSLQVHAFSHHAPRTAHFSLVTRYALLITLLLLAFGLRAHLLGGQSLWNDEGNAYVQATRSFTDIAYHAGRDIHPPGYYWLLAGWRALAGESEYALRLLSTFASVLTVAFTAALARRLVGSVGALAAALFVALNSFSIYYAQEARMYALLALWGVMSLWLLARTLSERNREGTESAEGNSRRDGMNAVPTKLRVVGTAFMPSAPHLRLALALGLVNAAGLYTQYAYFYVLLTQTVVVALWMVAAWNADVRGDSSRGQGTPRPYSRLVAVIGAQALAFILFVPWLPTALIQIRGWPNTGQPVELAQALNVILNWLIYGVTARNELLAVAWLLLLFGLVRLPRLAFLPAAWVTVSVGVFLAQGLFRENNLKFLLPAQVGMALWMGSGVAVLWDARFVRSGAARVMAGRRWIARAAGVAAAVLILVVMVRGLDPLYHDPAYQRADYRAMARLAAAELGAGDVIILNGPNQAEVFNYYYRGAAQVIGLPAGLGGDDAATEAALTEMTRSLSDDGSREYHQVFAVLWGERERDPNSVVEGLLDNTFYSAGETWYGDVRLARYAVRTSASAMVIGTVNATFDDGRINMQADYTAEARVGGMVLARLTWLNRTEAPIPQRYKVFVQLLNSDGVLVAQHDSEPSGGSSPTNAWQPGSGIADNHAILVPPDALPGDYTLIAGMYAVDPPNARLTLSDGSDHVVLGQITVR